MDRVGEERRPVAVTRGGQVLVECSEVDAGRGRSLTAVAVTVGRDPLATSDETGEASLSLDAVPAEGTRLGVAVGDDAVSLRADVAGWCLLLDLDGEQHVDESRSPSTVEGLDPLACAPHDLGGHPLLDGLDVCGPLALRRERLSTLIGQSAYEADLALANAVIP